MKPENPGRLFGPAFGCYDEPMTTLNIVRNGLAAGAAVLILAGCGGAQPSIGSPGIPAPPPDSSLAQRLPAHSIEHVIVVVQQERSFENLFAGYPGAYTVTKGETHTGKFVPLKAITLETNGQPGNGVTLPDLPATFATEFANGAMNGFDLINFGPNGKGRPAHLYPYAYVTRRETDPYWDLAKRYALADHMFSTERAGSFAASQVLIAGSTALADGKYVVGVTNAGGCDAPPGTRTILSGGGHGPRPCFTWKTMADLLDAKGVSWKYYTLPCSGRDADFGCFWNAFEAIKRVRYGRDWTRNVSMPSSNIFTDLKHVSFPAVSWVTPTLGNSDDSVSGRKSGPAWVTSIVDAVKGSRYWNSTAIVVIWGDWGGYYEDVTPPALDSIGLSMRVPMLVISPDAKSGYISHTDYELASILKFVEQNWGLGTLSNTDERATSIGDMFK